MARPRALTSRGGGTYVHKFPKSLTLTVGAEGAYSTLNDKSGYRAHGIDQVTTTWSQYDQLEYSTDRWNFLLGGRFDMFV